MSPITKRPFGFPIALNGTVARVVIEGREAQVETWGPDGWQQSGLTLADILYTPVASQATLVALAVPPKDWGRSKTTEQTEKEIRDRMDRKMKAAQEMIIENLREHANDPD